MHRRANQPDDLGLESPVSGFSNGCRVDIHCALLALDIERDLKVIRSSADHAA
jgi:hypothetical protein